MAGYVVSQLNDGRYSEHLWPNFEKELPDTIKETKKQIREVGYLVALEISEFRFLDVEEAVLNIQSSRRGRDEQGRMVGDIEQIMEAIDSGLGDLISGSTVEAPFWEVEWDVISPIWPVFSDGEGVSVSV